MHLKISAAIALVSALLSPALAAPQGAPPSIATGSATTTLPAAASTDTSVAVNQLAELVKHASQITNTSLDSDGKRRRDDGESCTRSKLSIRREWGTLSKNERKAYIAAVQCLRKKQADTPASVASGAKTRFDDWLATHINQTQTIHYTGTFLAWHRYFTWAYEQALRNECGYKGTQPYWDWSKTAITGLEKSPIFDGSDTSLGSNGAYIPGNEKGQVNVGGPVGSDLPPLFLPTGYGGGCIKSGPFKDATVNLGPVNLALPNGSYASNGNGLSYNPRCLTRDLVDSTNRRFANATSIVRTIVNFANINDFQMVMQGIPGTGDLGIHGGPHLALGGDPGRDTYTSPGDPVFYLHHSGIDRVWWLWQSLDYNTRTGPGAIAGTRTFLNMPPSANVTADDWIDFGFVGVPRMQMKDLLSTTRGPFCYSYA